MLSSSNPQLVSQGIFLRIPTWITYTYRRSFKHSFRLFFSEISPESSIFSQNFIGMYWKYHFQSFLQGFIIWFFQNHQGLIQESYFELHQSRVCPTLLQKLLWQFFRWSTKKCHNSFIISSNHFSRSHYMVRTKRVNFCEI